jgi:RNA 2',3'-cyclic 3'-phosphodiesterase
VIRLFVGLGLPVELAGRLAAMASGIPGARWVEARNLHVTLRFIGEVEEGVAHDIHDALVELAEPAFELGLDGFDAIGSRRRAHSLVVAVERSAPLVHLRDKIESAVVRLGLPPEPRKFAPHITLARLKDAPASRIQSFISHHSPLQGGPFPVNHFTLFRSHLSRNGAEYEAMAEYGLR